MKRGLLFACISFGIALVGTQPVVGQTANSPSLAGSWELTLLPISPIAAPLIPISGLATFTSGGSVVETDATETVPTVGSTGMAIYGTPGHGIWQPGPAIGNLFIQLVSLLLNHNGSLHAKKTVTIAGRLDSTGNQFSGNYSFEVVDPTGRVIATGSGTVTAQRIPHPLLP
jgi:hypothetical protein